MKDSNKFKLFFAAMFLAWLALVVITNVWAMEPGMPPPDEEAGPMIPFGKCPRTQVVGRLSDCMVCHVAGNWEVKETSPLATMTLPSNLDYVNGRFIYTINGGLGHGDFVSMKQAVEYALDHGATGFTVDIYSPGGELFGMWEIIGLLRKTSAGGVPITTRVYGTAMSAAFVIFMAGDVRVMTSGAMLMWHEVAEGQMFQISTPASSADQNQKLAYFQEGLNRYLSERSGCPVELIAREIHKKEWWINGQDALKLGFATEIIQ